MHTCINFLSVVVSSGCARAANNRLHEHGFHFTSFSQRVSVALLDLNLQILTVTWWVLWLIYNYINSVISHAYHVVYGLVDSVYRHVTNILIILLVFTTYIWASPLRMQRTKTNYTQLHTNNTCRLCDDTKGNTTTYNRRMSSIQRPYPNSNH